MKKFSLLLCRTVKPITPVVKCQVLAVPVYHTSVPAAHYSSLSDTHGRFHNYLRISLSEKCNLRCQYCMPEEGVPLSPRSDLLTSTEIYDLSRMFVKYGVTKIRLTGGEPTVRKDLPDVISSLSSLRPHGLKLIGMTTNGITLHRKAKLLCEAGLDLVNISLDTLQPEKFQFITRRNGFNHVIKGIDAALEQNFKSVKINCVVMKGLNEDEILSFVQLTKDKPLHVRFIEYMPFDGNKWNKNKFVSYLEMMKIIKTEYPNMEKTTDHPNDASKSYKVPGYEGSVGFITSMSDLFCSGCNRIRLTTEGNLKVCLFDNREVSLRDELRNGSTDDQLAQFVFNALQHKKKQHSGMNNLVNQQNRPMILIGRKQRNKRLPIEASFPISLYRNTGLQTLSVRSCSRLSHVDSSGKANMVDVSAKHATIRQARAEVTVSLGEAAYSRVKLNEIQKGDVLAVSRLAAIQAAKKTSELVPLCHQVPLSHVGVDFELVDDIFSIIITTECKTVSSTGVEMEALTSASIAALTIYDMCKAVTHSITITNLHLVSKSGGKTTYHKSRQ